jgi:hypothetical protein
MRKALIIGGVVLIFVVLGVITAALYWAGDDDQSALERFRDIAIIYLGFLWLFAVMLLVVITGLVLWLVLTVKDRIMPAIDKLVETTGTLAETATRVKNTTDFVTEEVAAPIISAYGSIAKARALMRTVTGRDKPDRKTVKKIMEE